MFKKGHTPWNKGKKRPEHAKKMQRLYREGKLGIYKNKEDFTEETKKKISEACKGREAWNKGKTGINTGPPKGTKPWNTGKKWSDDMRKKIGEGVRKAYKKKNKGKKKKRNGWRMWEWTKDVIARDGECQVCGSKDNLEAHHILPKSKFPEKMYDLDNGVTLCHECHLKTDTYGARLDLEDETIVRTCEQSQEASGNDLPISEKK